MTFHIEWYRQIKRDVIFSARKANIARQLITVRPVTGGIGTQQWSWNSAAEVSDAQLSWAINVNNEDMINLTPTNKPIPVLHKEFRIGARDIATAQNGGYPLSTITAQSAAYKTTVLENQLILNGYAADGTNYDINGFYQGAGNTEGTAKDFGTAGNAISKIGLALAVLHADEIYGAFNLVLNDVQYMELAVSVMGAGAGNPEMPMVEKLLGGGKIYSTSYQAVNTGMLIAAPNPMFYELIVPQDMTTKTVIEPKSGDLWGQVFECVLPAIYEPNAICTLTGI
jgi:uncharacterized linocin/CFP29 family protein